MRRNDPQRLIETLREIADGRLTLIGSNIPDIIRGVGDRIPEGAESEAILQEREAARLLVDGYSAAFKLLE